MPFRIEVNRQGRNLGIRLGPDRSGPLNYLWTSRFEECDDPRRRNRPRRPAGSAEEGAVRGGKATIRRAMCTYRDGELIVKWDLDSQKPMKGAATRRIRGLISELVAEGLL